MSALDENIRSPAIAATAKADQVHGRASAVRSETERPRFASPRSRRSTIDIDPTTNANASTCRVSMDGKSQVDSRIALGKPRFCTHVQSSLMDIAPPFYLQM